METADRSTGTTTPTEGLEARVPDPASRARRPATLCVHRAAARPGWWGPPVWSLATLPVMVAQQPQPASREPPVRARSSCFDRGIHYTVLKLFRIFIPYTTVRVHRVRRSPKFASDTPDRPRPLGLARAMHRRQAPFVVFLT